MATKTFKIGLSNTDKQNMAQDVYERLLALTFPEYDSAESYDVGDFVVYNDQLYKCIGATTGAWDSTKWQLATLNDLVSDIENAVAFVNDKANVDGNYPTMTVGVADNLSPYDEESGIKQHAPFNFQASGTNNGDDPTATVGALAIMNEKRGNTVVVNQPIQNGTFTSTDNWLVPTDRGSLSVSSNKATITWNGQQNNWYQNRIAQVDVFKTTGHKYYINATITSSFNARIRFGRDVGDIDEKSVTANTKTTIYGIITTTDVGDLWICCDVGQNAVNNDTTIVENVFVIDLTQWFNGDIPQDLLDNPENFFRYYQGSLAYNTGELVNANSRYLKAIGRNQLNPSACETGAINSTNGELASDSNWVSTDYIRVSPNSTLYCKVITKNSSAYGYAWYDKDKNYISGVNFAYNNTTLGTVVAPSNALYLRVSIHKENNPSWETSACISLYYEGESGYDKYYPYEVLTNNDTGVEVLRSVGSVFDSKTPDGTITRRVGVVDLSTLSWYYNNEAKAWISTGLSGLIKPPVDNYTKPNLNCDKYQVLNVYDIYGVGDNSVGRISCLTNENIIVNNGSSTTQPSGTIYYELAEPTTEQGTPYSENIAIDDFGTMDFSGTSGVPQGNALFYPVDYKAYLDTLHNYTDGDPANLALNSELNSKFENYLKSLSGYDASATQVLKNISGTLTWVTEGE